MPIVTSSHQQNTHKMETQVITITPEMASRFLEYNHINRGIRPKNIKYWEACIIGDSVKLTHQGIALQGTIQDPVRLIDGQHRLLAIVNTGIPTKFLLATNVPEDSFENIDGGMPRSMSDRARIDKTLVEIASAMYYTRAGINIRPPVALIKDLANMLHPHFEHVENKRKKGLSTAYQLLAFVIQQKTMGYNYASSFQNGKFLEIPESLMALYRRQLSTNPVGSGGGQGRIESLAATLNAIANPSLTRVSIPRLARKYCCEVIDESFELTPKYIKHHGIPIPKC